MTAEHTDKLIREARNYDNWDYGSELVQRLADALEAALAVGDSPAPESAECGAIHPERGWVTCTQPTGHPHEHVSFDHPLAGQWSTPESAALSDEPTDEASMPTEWGVYIPAVARLESGPNIYVLYGDTWRMSPDIGNADEHARSAHERWGLVLLGIEAGRKHERGER